MIVENMILITVLLQIVTVYAMRICDNLPAMVVTKRVGWGVSDAKINHLTRVTISQFDTILTLCLFP